MPRVEWSPDGSELLSVVGGTLRRGETIVEGPNVLDARWRGDASIIAIDNRGNRTWYRGGAVETAHRPQNAIAYVTIADVDECLVVFGAEYIGIQSLAGGPRWTLDPWKHGLGSFEHRTGAAISADGKFVAIGYETAAIYTRREGRGFVVIDVAEDAVLDRRWYPVNRSLERVQFAFDRAGRRLVMTTPEAGPALPAFRIDRDEKYPQTHAGGSRAVAIDQRGILAVYAYAKTSEQVPRRLRVDYLEPGVKGGSAIAINDTLWIDPDATDIVALAIDQKSRRIACLDASGRIEVVPVP